jgi:hypothetical protein
MSETKCEMCKKEKATLIKGRLCLECYKDAQPWVRDLVDNRNKTTIGMERNL